uniref:CRISPR-associated endonuclease Cas1 n=1 Tax=Prevotella sp. GTC17259 TaxID=3236795 RepID=A0AB33J3B7_9BACT
MLKRSLVFTSPATLSMKDRQLIISLREQPEEKRTIPIEDLGFVLIAHPQVMLTVPLMNALSENNVSLVFCNSKGMPSSMLLNLNTNVTQGETIRNQIDAGEVLKKNIWKQIVEAKIRNQSFLLSKLGKQGELLKPLFMNVKSGDTDNREGIAAKIYWAELFGKDFLRNRDMPGINSLLNYGYTILRSAVARSLMSAGLFPAIGVFHRNRSNAFPLADDLMEPYRPFIDEIVYKLHCEGKEELNKETKAELIRLLYCDTYFKKVTRPLSVGLSLTMASLVRCYAKTTNKLVLPEMR